MDTYRELEEYEEALDELSRVLDKLRHRLWTFTLTVHDIVSRLNRLVGQVGEFEYIILRPGGEGSAYSFAYSKYANEFVPGVAKLTRSEIDDKLLQYTSEYAISDVPYYTLLQLKPEKPYYTADLFDVIALLPAVATGKIVVVPSSELGGYAKLLQILKMLVESYREELTKIHEELSQIYRKLEELHIKYGSDALPQLLVPIVRRLHKLCDKYCELLRKLDTFLDIIT